MYSTRLGGRPLISGTMITAGPDSSKVDLFLLGTSEETVMSIYRYILIHIPYHRKDV